MSWARALGGYANINPMLLTQHGNRMHFFIAPGPKANFDADLERREADADESWMDESGEAPRV